MIRIYRPITSFLSAAGLLVLSVHRAYFATHEYSALWDFVAKFVVVPFCLLLLIRLLLKPAYIVVNEGRLTIYRDLFVRKVIDVDEIDRIELASGPFSKSYFVLKSHTKVGFHFYDLRSNAFKILEEKLGKRVVDVG